MKVFISQSFEGFKNFRKCNLLGKPALAFNNVGETNSKMKAPDRAKSLAYYDLLDKIYKKFQNYSDDKLDSFSRKRATQVFAANKMRVLNMPFETSFTDYTAAI